MPLGSGSNSLSVLGDSQRSIKGPVLQPLSPSFILHPSLKRNGKSPRDQLPKKYLGETVYLADCLQSSARKNEWKKADRSCFWRFVRPLTCLEEDGKWNKQRPNLGCWHQPGWTANSPCFWKVLWNTCNLCIRTLYRNKNKMYFFFSFFFPNLILPLYIQSLSPSTYCFHFQDKLEDRVSLSFFFDQVM